MNDSFVTYLNVLRPDTDLVHQALRMYLSERTNDKPPAALRDELEVQAADPNALQQALTDLEGEPLRTEAAALAFLSNAWDVPSESDRIRAAFEHAKRQMPVIETAILALVAMYGMYLIASGGRRSRTIKRKADGSFEETEVWEDPSSWVSGIGTLFGAKGKK
jgi:hypothetical protein